MLNLSSAYMTHSTSHGSFRRHRIVTIQFKTVAEACLSVLPPSLTGFSTLQHSSLSYLFSEQMVCQCAFIEISWKTEGCPMLFLFFFFYHIVYILLFSPLNY